MSGLNESSAVRTVWLYLGATGLGLVGVAAALLALWSGASVARAILFVAAVVAIGGAGACFSVAVRSSGGIRGTHDDGV